MINKDTKIYCSFAKEAGNVGCQIFNSAFNYYGLDSIYKSFSINNIKSAVDSVRTLDIKGFAVTMPFKIEVIDYLDELESGVQSISAVNTVINDNGYLIGYNTDYLAAKEVLDECLGIDLYILGNGGYSRAVQQAAKDLNYKPKIISRNNWKDIKDIKNSIVYNCTPVKKIKVDKSNKFIDCIVSTPTGKRLSWIQASYQFKLYTNKKLPIRSI